MPKKKRKKNPRLPNAFGSIRYLGDNRSNPYAVHPPSKLADDLGDYIRPKALCYVNDWYVGFAVLNAYHAGTYHPGDELKFSKYKPLDNDDLDIFCRRILADYSVHAHAETIINADKKTFSEIYEAFFDRKYGPNATKKLSKQSVNSTKAAYKRLSKLHNKIFENITHKEMQDIIDQCDTKAATRENMISLLHQMYRYASLFEGIEKDYSIGLQVGNAEEDEHGVPFSENDLRILWNNQNDPVVEFMLIMCYSGFRISAYLTIETNTKEWYFKGGVKTDAGKGRIVPIHTAIRPLVEKRLKRDRAMLNVSAFVYRDYMYKKLEELNIDHHTPHDCRTTFSCLCEKYEVKENDRKRMLGHKFQDITNKVYSHRELEDLRTEIEKISIPNKGSL